MIWPFGNKQREVDRLIDAITDGATITPSPEPTPSPKVHYTVGNDDTGNTVLKVGGDGYYTTTLTMNASGTRQLIKLLSATLQEERNE